MQIIIISPDTDLANEKETVNNLFKNGLECFHLRKPNYNFNDYECYLLDINPQYYPQIIIHGAYDLIHKMGLGGAHLRSALRENGTLKHALSEKNVSEISTSVHSWNELITNAIEYKSMFISPLFDSISKVGYKANIALDGIETTRLTIATKNIPGPKIMGLGGINIDNILNVKSMGFDAAALLGYIWKPANPVAAFKAIQSLLIKQA